jgi:hypothetical protein
MEIKASELDTSEMENIGELDDSSVKLVRTLGGLYLAVGKPKGKKQDEVLAAGSHRAIVKYNVQKNFQSFRPVLEKSEGLKEEVFGLSEKLPRTLRDKGYDLYRLEKSSSVEIHVTKHGIDIASLGLENKDSLLEVQLNSGKIPEGVGKAIAESAAEFAVNNGLDSVRHAGKIFKAVK